MGAQPLLICVPCCVWEEAADTMSTPPLRLTHDQAVRLDLYMQTYRTYTIATLLPSPERNILLRILQTLRGKLIVEREQPTARHALTLYLAKEEVTALKKTITDLFTLYASQPESTERLFTLSDLTSLKACLNKTFES